MDLITRDPCNRGPFGTPCHVCSADALEIMDTFVQMLKAPDQTGKPLFSPRELRKLRRETDRMGKGERPNN